MELCVCVMIPITASSSGNDVRLNHRAIYPTLENLPYGKFSGVWLKTNCMTTMESHTVFCSKKYHPTYAAGWSKPVSALLSVDFGCGLYFTAYQFCPMPASATSGTVNCAADSISRTRISCASFAQDFADSTTNSSCTCMMSRASILALSSAS